MNESMTVTVTLCGAAFILGLSLSPIIRAQWYLWRHRKSQPGDIGVVKVPPPVRASIGAFIAASAVIAALSWYAEYYIQHNGLSPLWGSLASTIFGFAAAGLIGQIVFELLLRRQLLEQTSSVLANVMLTDKVTLKSIFSPRRIDEIARLCLGIMAESADAKQSIASKFGNQLFDRARHQIQDAESKPIREDFVDEIRFSRIPQDQVSTDLDGFFAVTDELTFVTRLPFPYFRVGIAPNTDKLFKLFNDRECIYRWLLQTDDEVFKQIHDRYPEYFRITVSLDLGGPDPEPCTIVESESGLTERGYEIVFQHPKRVATASGYTERANKVIVKAETLHSKRDHLVSVHLAYPVDKATISLESRGNAFSKIEGLTFLYGKRLNPQPVVDAKTGLKYRIQGDDWIMPGEGVVFFWEE